MSGPVSGITGATHRRFAKVAGMTAEAALVDAALGCPVEWQAPVFQIVDRLDGFLRQDVGRLLVDQIIAALDGIKGMPFGLVFLDIAQSGADPALGGAGMAANRIEFGENCCLRLLTGLKRGIEPGAAGADNDRVKLIDHVFLLLVNVMSNGNRICPLSVCVGEDS